MTSQVAICNFFYQQTKGVATRKTKKKPKPQMQRCPIEITGQQAENLWQDTVSAELSACLQGREEDVTNHNIVPFDPLSDVPVDDQVYVPLISIYYFFIYLLLHISALSLLFSFQITYISLILCKKPFIRNWLLRFEKK